MNDDAGDPNDEVSGALASWRRRTDWPLMVLAIGSLPLLLLEVDREDLALGDRRFLDIVNVVVLVAFTLDYVVELWLASNRRAHIRSERFGLLVVVAQALALAPNLAAFGALRALRAVKVLRLFAIVGRAIAMGGLISRDGRRLLRDHAAGLAIGAAGLTWVSSAVGFTMAEDVGAGGRLDSFFDALWWSLATITTVGYGDVYPVTTAGRVIGGLTMIVGISTFALVTAKVAQFLVRVDREDPPTPTLDEDVTAG